MANKRYSSQILEQHIVIYEGKYQVLFICKDNRYFITTNGAFGQRDMLIEELHESEALKLLNTK